LDTAAYSSELSRIIEVVRDASGPADILWSNGPYANGLVAALIPRPTSSAMLPEVLPSGPVDQPGSARVIVWFKFGVPGWDPLPTGLGRPVFDSQLAQVYRRSQGGARAAPPQAVMPLAAALALALAAAAWAARGLARPRQSSAIPV
jgi:hypothetical protein